MNLAAVDLTNFWDGMVQQLVQRFPGMERSLFHGKSAFNDLLMRWAGNKIVMAIDEFDKVLDDDSIRVELLDGLRAVKADLRKDGTSAGYNVQSVILIGPLSIIKAATVTTETTTKTAKKKTFLSPFNVTDAISSPTFTPDEVRVLFAEFKSILITSTSIIHIRIFEKSKHIKDGNWILSSLKAFTTLPGATGDWCAFVGKCWTQSFTIAQLSLTGRPTLEGNCSLMYKVGLRPKE